MNNNLQKIVMIGPVYPYKGGIAHYTGLMYRALADKYKVEMISFKLQYPKFLFKKEQKDFTNDTFKIDHTKYWINTVDPLNCIRIAAKIKQSKPDLVIFQWWHPYFAPCYWLIEKVLGRKIKKLFVCHNVFPHERFPMDRFLSKTVLKNGDYFITQSKLDSEDLLSINKNAKYVQTVHPTYNAFKLKNMTREEARTILNIDKDEKILLFFGFVRKYKGLSHLINALPKIIEELSGLKLYIVGDFDGNKESYLELIKNNHVQDCVSIFDGYIPDDEVEKFFAASDLVVLPYESATQSGIVQIAYSFEKPVIVTDVGGLPEVVSDGETGYIVPCGDDFKLAEAVLRFFRENKAEAFKEHIALEADKYSWSKMVEVLENLVEQEPEV